MNETVENGGADKKDQALLIVQSKVRDVIRAREKRVSDEFINALSDKVHRAIDKAIARCTANGRSTLRPEDL